MKALSVKDVSCGLQSSVKANISFRATLEAMNSGLVRFRESDLRKINIFWSQSTWDQIFSFLGLLGRNYT